MPTTAPGGRVWIKIGIPRATESPWRPANEDLGRRVDADDFSTSAILGVWEGDMQFGMEDGVRRSSVDEMDAFGRLSRRSLKIGNA